jgi:hypothetical protein
MRRLLIALVALIVVPSAAGAITLTVTVTTGNPLAAPGVTLNGVDQTQTFAIASRVLYMDDSGNGNNLGWNVTVSGTAPTVAGRSLPFLTMTNVTRAACTNDTSGNSCVNPTNNVAWPGSLTINATPAKIYNATANTGKGNVVLTATYVISYPANAISGTYSSTVTYAVATGP